MNISRRSFLRLFVAIPAMAALVPALAKISPRRFVLPPADPITHEIWWFDAKRHCVVSVPGHPVFELEPGWACCFQNVRGWGEDGPPKWQRIDKNIEP